MLGTVQRPMLYVEERFIPTVGGFCCAAFFLSFFLSF